MGTDKVIPRIGDGTPAIEAIRRKKDRDILIGAMESYHRLQEEFQECKDTISLILQANGLDKVQHGDLRALRSEITREKVDPELIRASGIRSPVIAKAAWGISKAKLIENGADADVVQGCVKTNTSVSVSVRKVAEKKKKEGRNPAPRKMSPPSRLVE